MQLQLPDAASLQRTDAVAREVEKILAETEGVQNYTTIAGLQPALQHLEPYAGFYFVQLEPWDERGARDRGRDHARAEPRLRERARRRRPSRSAARHSRRRQRAAAST